MSETSEQTLRHLLSELVAQVRGECPSLLSEDSGGDARLSMAIDDALAAPEQGDVEQLSALLPGGYYMDPPDGGDVSVMEQLRRMAADAEKWRNQFAGEQGDTGHDSDCALHNMPAYPNGPCDCSVSEHGEVELPEPAFRLTWRDGAYRVSKPGIEVADCYTADQVRAVVDVALARKAGA